MLKKIKKIIFVVGCQRSGTTLLGLMLGASKNTVMLDESDGIYNWFDMQIQNAPEASESFRSVLNRAAQKYKNSSESFVYDSDNNCSLSPEVEYLVLKAPNLTYRYKDFEKLGIPFCVIYAVRDSRSVVSSMLELTQVNIVNNQLKLLKTCSNLRNEFHAEAAILTRGDQPDHVNFALIWRIKSALFQRYIDSGIASYLCRYEELIGDTARVCKEMLDQLGIPFDESILMHHNVYDGTAQGETDRSRSVDRKSLNKWSSKLNDQQVREVLSISRSTMVLLEYLGQSDFTEIENSSVVCVLGMHRSGTSCLTGCLQDSGLYLGDVVTHAPHNIKGNRESLSLRAINDRVLEFNNGSWDNPPTELLWDDKLRSYRDAFISIYSAHSQWGFKDPRTTLTLPFWLEALPEMKFVGTFRHPIYVARSLESRSNFIIEDALKLWEAYNLKLLEYAEDYDFPIVCFDWPEKKYLQAVKKVAQSFGLSNIAKDEEVAFFEKGLRHHRYNAADSAVPKDMQYLYRLYKKLRERAENFIACD